MPKHRARSLAAALALAASLASPSPGSASDFSQPWRQRDRALVVDAYEYNSIDWPKLATDRRVVGFINKATDGLPPPFACPGEEMEARLCKALWKRYAVARELFQTRRAMAKALGLKWGAYHLARPGNPIEQANHFIDFAEPGPDDLVAIDVEENDPTKWMSLADAEEFARHVMRRIGRYPVLYTNGTTAEFIAAHRDDYPLLSRLPLWYARYKPEIGVHFPIGNWDGYVLWQFSSLANCSERRCPYRVPGTPPDIDVNVATMNAEALRKAWPLDDLAGGEQHEIASVPVPLARADALAGKAAIIYADVDPRSMVKMLAAAYAMAGERYPARQPPLFVQERKDADALVAFLAALKTSALAYVGALAGPDAVDMTETAALEPKPVR